MNEHRAPKIPPPVVVAAVLSAQRLLAGDRRGGIACKAAAGVLLAASAGLSTWADLAFGAAKTSINPLRPERSSTLVVSGANAVSRNPMYLGMVGAATAHALWRGSFRALLPVAGLVLWLDRLQIPAEEEALQAKFGQAYEDYKERVPRWIQLPSTLIWLASRDRLRAAD